MKNSSEKIIHGIYIGILALMLVFSGYLRDSIFKSMNALLRAWDLDQDYYLPKLLSFLQDYEYNTIVNLKWILTILFSILYLIFSLLAVKLFYNDWKYYKITILTYLGILILSGLFILSGFIFEGSSEKMYEFARFLMGMAQSPIVLMILIPAFKLSEKENAK